MVYSLHHNLKGEFGMRMSALLFSALLAFTISLPSLADTWNDSIPIYGVTSVNSPAIGFLHDRMYAFFSPNGTEVYFKYSSNGGVSWSPRTLLCKSAFPVSALQVTLDKSASGNQNERLYVVWKGLDDQLIHGVFAEYLAALGRYTVFNLIPMVQPPVGWTTSATPCIAAKPTVANGYTYDQMLIFLWKGTGDPWQKNLYMGAFDIKSNTYLKSAPVYWIDGKGHKVYPETKFVPTMVLNYDEINQESILRIYYSNYSDSKLMRCQSVYGYTDAQIRNGEFGLSKQSVVAPNGYEAYSYGDVFSVRGNPSSTAYVGVKALRYGQLNYVKDDFSGVQENSDINDIIGVPYTVCFGNKNGTVWACWYSGTLDCVYTASKQN
jgi:hypothetical protein